MKKYLIVLAILLYTFTSCEDDDFCYEETTPRLIFGFYDKDSPTTKKALPIYVWADSKDSIYQLATVDSILVPLDTQKTSTLYKIASTNIIDEFNFNYTVSDKYISESCGYIAIFNDFSLKSHTSNWIDRVDITVTKVENETQTHVKIYH
tara:strand:+ start:4764 stop:5213 length:450 start_codon:yes stop_codon:yes gene_type:complete